MGGENSSHESALTTNTFIFYFTREQSHTQLLAMSHPRNSQSNMDQYCIRIPRKYILKPKKDEGVTCFRQSNIELYCIVVKKRKVLRHKTNYIIKQTRQLRLKTVARR